MKINGDDIYNSFYEFYHEGSNKVDMLRHKSTADIEKWGKKEYVKLAKDNPVKFLLKTEFEYFRTNEEVLIGLHEELEEFVDDECFIRHFNDVVHYRIDRYYSERNL
ncbi:hypothetical protein [Clostridium neonatale]|mgnify:FL=1|uniref:hypothetical protein n=1 Tax=Clostridium neonatale TaxID=137838 RepID=UPI00291B3B86|nr:hypothetical protein [Clostridium neonatale]CAI3202836.1 hypothetical protein CNEO2_360030 [Clostridium neonatale]CAI3214352.1 hypothetical protein CNEO2_60070 [Clostridium neonatale]CAI3695611.1 hypothetical protein CNEO4_800002 [Clostridium neonatale]